MKDPPQRPRDIADIEGILEAHPNLDCAPALIPVKGMAQALDIPDIYPKPEPYH